MTIPSITLFSSWSYGLAAICHFALAAYLMPRQFMLRRTKERDRVGDAIAAAAAISVIWSLFSLLDASDQYARWTPPELGRLLDVILYAGWYAVPLTLMYLASGPSKAIPRLAGAGAIVLLTAATTIGLAFVMPGQEVTRISRYVFLGMAVFGLLLLEQVYRNAGMDSRWQLKPMIIGLGAAFLFDLYFYSQTLLFNYVDSTTYSVRGFAYVLAAPLIAITLLRARTRKLKMTISQSAAFHTTTLIAAGLYLLLASAMGYYVRYLGGDWGEALQLAVVFAALVLLVFLMLSRTAQAKLRVLVGKHFFSYRYDYREEWLRFTKAMITADATPPLGQRVIRGLADMVESPAGTLWLIDAQSRCYVQSARWNMPEVSTVEPEDSVLMEFISERGWIIDLEEYRARPGQYHGLTLPVWLSEALNAWLIVPLMAAGAPIGFVVLATSRTSIDINWEVKDLLKTAGSQAASYLAQMQVTEALLEARKFDAFNRMSAFVVHDLKNIVSQLSLLVRNAEKHASNPEFQRDMLLTVKHSVERMKQLMLQLREGRSTDRGARNISLGTVARRVQAAKVPQFPRLQLDVRHDSVARGDEERVERVIGHLVQNAIDATRTDGQIWISVDKEADSAVVEVGDTGIGMSEEFVRTKLFKPFHTTKEEGTGIGAYESYQYIKDIGGNIVVISEETRGSRFQIRLPLATNEPASNFGEDPA